VGVFGAFKWKKNQQTDMNGATVLYYTTIESQLPYIQYNGRKHLIKTKYLLLTKSN